MSDFVDVCVRTKVPDDDEKRLSYSSAVTVQMWIPASGDTTGCQLTRESDVFDTRAFSI